MYLKSTHSPLDDGGHKWEVTLFCNKEAHSIGHVDIIPKSKASKVIPNESKPPTAYTMVYITNSKYDNPPEKFAATITFLKTNEKKTVSVPANMATDRKRRKPDEDENIQPDNEKEPLKKKRNLFSFIHSFTSKKESEDAPPGNCCTIM